jgi:hypothetical protein
MKKLVLVINWDSIDQSLVNASDELIEEFVSEAKLYATEMGIGFETIRNIQRPSFFLSHDGDEKLDDLDEIAEAHFIRICERLFVGAK